MPVGACDWWIEDGGVEPKTGGVDEGYQMSMTPEAKRALSGTIRALRTRLLDDLHAATEGAYRLSLKAKDAKLSEEARIRRERFDNWISEQVRALPKKEQGGASDRFRLEVEKDAASTLLNRIVFLRLLEASGLREERVATGGWESRGYKDFREFALALVRGDESEGYAQLLQLVFDDLAIDLPGLYGHVRLTKLIPVPAATLRAVVDALDAPELESCWTDDMTLGWVYQYWNDPEREALDRKLNDGGKVEPHEIASKTQMFTERYMVDWLLQNSLGPMWLAMCKKRGWTAEVEADGTLARLEERRTLWRAKRDAGEISLTELMPFESEAERRWSYYVPQTIPNDAVKYANESVRDLKILDPAVGSGHFLVVAFDLLAALYREEARHCEEEGEPQWSEQAIVERILEHNLHGIDLDPRAVQIAAAALWLKSLRTCAEAHPRQLNLVASNLRLSSLPADDPARRELREEVERDTGIPAELTQQLIDALAGADHLGSLLRIDAAVDKALANCELFLNRSERAQGDPPSEDRKDRRLSTGVEEAKATMLSRLELFLHAHSHGDDLGLKLKGEQLAAGVRFVRSLKEGAYDLVVANPPYQGTSKMVDSKYIEKQYPLGKADLYAAFLLRGLQLVRDGGVSAMLTMRNWMFIKQYSGLREGLLEQFDLRTLGDLNSGAFQEISGVVVSVAMTVFANDRPTDEHSVALKSFNDESLLQVGETERKRAATLCHVGRHEFDPSALKVVPEWPLVYWWDDALLSMYSRYPLLGDLAPARATQGLYSNTRFIRRAHEVQRDCIRFTGGPTSLTPWVPLTNGADGTTWFEPLREIACWGAFGLEPKSYMATKVGGAVYRYANEQFFFVPGGVAYTTIGSEFAGRRIRYTGIFANKGRSLYGADSAGLLCLLNSAIVREIACSLNPGVGFESGDVNRLPALPIAEAATIIDHLESVFAVRESHREPSVEFRSPGASSWSRAQAWAQLAVDRPEGLPLPAYVEELDPEPSTDHLSFAFGVAVGRFGPTGEGILDPSKSDLSAALPGGICFLDGSLERSATGDSLGHSAVETLHTKWSQHGPVVDPDTDLRTWLRLKFFGDVHKGMYENRPIYFPLSSEKKTFVAYVSIHRWTEDTLRALLAEHLNSALTRLEGEIADLRESRQSADKKVAREGERRYDQVARWKQELDDFISQVEQCAEKGPPTPDAKIPEREVDARYAPDLDDGVMINSAALWPLLEPQWKDPKKWWKELATAKGKKDYDWAHLAARYYPNRVDQKCQQDPSLGVAHGCFWKYHAENAYKWELRLQDEIAPGFTIDEDGSDAARRAFEEADPEKVEALVEAEGKRRAKNKKKQQKEEASRGPLFDAEHAGDASSGAVG